MYLLIASNLMNFSVEVFSAIGSVGAVLGVSLQQDVFLSTVPDDFAGLVVLDLVPIPGPSELDGLFLVVERCTANNEPVIPSVGGKSLVFHDIFSPFAYANSSLCSLVYSATFSAKLSMVARYKLSMSL